MKNHPQNGVLREPHTTKQSLPHIEARLGTPEFFRDPYPVYNQLRKEAPVYWCAKWNAWLVSRNDDVQAVLRDPQTFSNGGRGTLLFENLEKSVRTRLQGLQGKGNTGLVNSDPPAHNRLRKLANKAFTPAMVESLRPRVEAIVRMLLDRVEPGKPFDIISALAFPLPSIVITEMLGSPSEDSERLMNWSEGIMSLHTGKVTTEAALRYEQCAREIKDYFRDLIQQRRKSPKKDLLSDLSAVNEDGDMMSDDDLFDTCVTLLLAGHETTTSLIGNGVLELLKDPSQMEILRAEPELLKTAVEEMLRFHSAVLAIHRRVVKDVTLRGQQIASGDLLYVVIASANRDPEVFTEPDRFNIRRPSAENRHVAFGYGVHFCLGAPLARMEAPIAIRALMTRFPKLRLNGEPRWNASMVTRDIEHLPVCG